MKLFWEIVNTIFLSFIDHDHYNWTFKNREEVSVIMSCYIGIGMTRRSQDVAHVQTVPDWNF